MKTDIKSENNLKHLLSYFIYLLPIILVILVSELKVDMFMTYDHSFEPSNRFFIMSVCIALYYSIFIGGLIEDNTSLLKSSLKLLVPISLIITYFVLLKHYTGLEIDINLIRLEIIFYLLSFTGFYTVNVLLLDKDKLTLLSLVFSLSLIFVLIFGGVPLLNTFFSLVKWTFPLIIFVILSIINHAYKIEIRKRCL